VIGIVETYRTATARLRPEQRDAIFAGTAARVYRLGHEQDKPQRAR